MAVLFNRDRGGWDKQVYDLEHREIAGAKIHETSSTQLFPIGSRTVTADGRVFRYAKDSGTGLAAGKLVGSDITAAEREDTLTVAADAGSNYITYTAAGTVTANEYQNGFMCIVSGTGQGEMCGIKEHDAITAAATGNIYLKETLITGVDTTSDVILMRNMYASATLNPDVIRKTLGVPTVPVTASNYFWVQTYGPALVLAGDSLGNLATERECFPATSTGEYVSTDGGVPGTERIGYHIFDSTDGVDTEYWPIFLTCDI